MEVNVKITSEEAVITLNDGSKEYTRKWEKTSFGAETTEDSLDFEELNLNEDLADAIENIEIYEVMKHLETEEYALPDREIKTKDGHILKKGDRFYGIGIQFSEGVGSLTPFRCTFPQDFYSLGDEENIYKSFKEALSYSNLENEKPNPYNKKL